MFVDQIMTRDVITVKPETKLARIADVMHKHKLRHLPVVDAEQRLAGIISHRDVQRAEPSWITTLDKGEANYLLSKVTAEKIMHHDVITCSSDTLVEQAGCIMREEKIGCLPVVDEGRLVGILTSVDLLDFFLDITGCRQKGGVRIAVHLEDRIGELAKLLSAINDQGGRIATAVSPVNPDDSGMRVVIVRFQASDPAKVCDALRGQGYDLISVALPE
ncbi:MAG: CBS and ACT domain-containing protein [Gammaproteobacteria bacterium]